MGRQQRASDTSHKSAPPHAPKRFPREVFILLILGIIFGLLLVVLAVNNKPSAIVNPRGSGSVDITPTPTPGLKPTSIVLLGYGGPDHDGGYLTDTIIQLVIRPQDKSIVMITIPRDLSVSIPVSETQSIQEKINAAFAIGMDDEHYPYKAPGYKASTNPGALTKYIVGTVTGIPVDSYVALSFSGFVKAIDTLGGIDVFFPVDFNDYRYPIKGMETHNCGRSDEEIATLSATLKGDELEKQFPCRFEHLYVPKGKQHLTGEVALKVARSRHSENLRGDFSRSERQRAIIQATKEKIFEIGFLPKAIPFIVSISRDLRTDLDLQTLNSLLPFAQELQKYKIISIALSDENVLNQGYNGRGQYVLVPKSGEEQWTLLQSYIGEEIQKALSEATPSATFKSY